MKKEKVREILQELYNLGLQDCQESKLLQNKIDEQENEKIQIDVEKFEEIKNQIEKYKKEIYLLKNKLDEKDTNIENVITNLLQEQKQQIKISPRDMDDKYKRYLQNKKELKKQLIKLKEIYVDKNLQENDLDEDLKKKIQLEKEFIKIMPYYEKLRNEVVKRLIDHTNTQANVLMEKNYLDYNYFKREYPKPNLQAVDKFEYQIKIEQEKRKKIKEKTFMNKVFDNNIHFAEFHKKKNKFQKKTAQQVKYYIENQKKKTDQMSQIEKRKRIEAFKSQEMNKYIDLLKETKEQRIIEILRETERFLKEIGLRVVKNKNKGQQIEDGHELLQKGQTEVDDQNNEYDFSKSPLTQENYQKIYYEFTHTSTEKIDQQPSILEGGQLKKYQLAGLSWMISLYNNRLNGILADEMGLGKTIQTIALFAYLIEKKQNYGPFLIVVPLSTLMNWKMEFDKWAPSVNLIVYKGNPQERKKLNIHLKQHKFNICLTTYEYVMKEKSELYKFHWKYIVVDEGHKLKNSQSKFAGTLGQTYQSENRLLLTGTPLQNNLTELWALFNFLLPSVFSSSEDFEKWFRIPMRKLGGDDQQTDLNEEEKMLLVHRFHQVLRPFLLRREKKEVENELPKKIEFIIKVELSMWQKIVYNQITDRESLNMLNNSKKYNRFMMNNVIMQQRKICNHPYIFREQYIESEEMMRCSGKFELLDRMVPKLLKTGHRILIFTQMTTVIRLLSIFFNYRGIKHLILDGSTKYEMREQRMQAFNRPNSEYPIFILSTRAGGLGLNLQTADTVIIFDSDWNPKVDEQAQDRAHRIGTKKEVRVYRFICSNTIEETILTKATQKKNLVETLIEAGLYDMNSTDYDRKERLEAIFKKQSLKKKVNKEVPNDEEVNRILARNDDEFDIFQNMDQQRYDQEKKYYENFSLQENYRLTQYEEVPEDIKELEESKEKEIELKERVRPNLEHLQDSSEEEYVSKKQKKKTKSVKRGNSKKNDKKQTIGNVDEMGEQIFIDSDN